MLSVRNAKINYNPALKHPLVRKVGEMLVDIPKNAAGKEKNAMDVWRFMVAKSWKQYTNTAVEVCLLFEMH